MSSWHPMSCYVVVVCWWGFGLLLLNFSFQMVDGRYRIRAAHRVQYVEGVLHCKISPSKSMSYRLINTAKCWWALLFPLGLWTLFKSFAQSSFNLPSDRTLCWLTRSFTDSHESNGKSSENFLREESIQVRGYFRWCRIYSLLIEWPADVFRAEGKSMKCFVLFSISNYESRRRRVEGGLIFMK